MNPSPAKLEYLWTSAHRIITESGEGSKPAEHENRIRGQYNQLLNNLTSVSEITAYMFQDGKLTAKELEHIEQFHSTPIRASDELLNIIMKRSLDVYECFLRSLKETKQHHVYQLLTTAAEQNDLSYSGEEFVSEHSRHIRQNYVWLTESLDPDHGLLTHLLEKEVLSAREYERLNSWKDKFKKNEKLLCIISRKSSVDFKHFQDALDKTLQPDINQKLTGSATDVESKQHKAAEKAKIESSSSTSGKRIPPKIPPKTRVHPKQVTHSTQPSRFEPITEDRRRTAQHNVNKRQVFNLINHFNNLQNELQTEISTEVVVLRKNTSPDNIWNICVGKILQESYKAKSRNHYNSTETECEKLRQGILQEKYKFTTLQNETRREKTITEKQLSILQENVSHLEASLKSAVNDKENLSKRLQESKFAVDNPKTTNKQIEQKDVAKERLISREVEEKNEALSIQLALVRKELEDQAKFYEQKLKETELRLRGAEKKLDQTEPSLNPSLRVVEEKNEALSIELAAANLRLEELSDQAKFYEQKLKETELRLREAEKKLDQTEPRLKPSLRVVEEKSEALTIELAAAKLRLEEFSDQSKFYDQKLKETELRLRGAEKKLVQTEPRLKPSLRVVEEKNEDLTIELAAAKLRLEEFSHQSKFYEQKLKETELRLREAEKKLVQTEPRLKPSLRVVEEKNEALSIELALVRKELEGQPKFYEQKLKETELRFRAAENKSDKKEQSLRDTEEKHRETKIKRKENEAKPIPLSSEKLRGEVDIHDKYKSDPVLVQEMRIETANGKKKSIWGLTILDKELYVVSQESSEVEVYDSNKFSFSRRWNLEELIDPTDIGSCKMNKCLYIRDYKESHSRSKEILRVDPKGKLIRKWSTGDDLGFGLSVTDESNVILAVFESSKLNEYSPDGDLIREVILSSDAGIHHPLHAIKLTNGDFVVSHGCDSNDLHRVCVWDAVGKLKKSFGGECGSAIRKMELPIYLVVGGNGFVMVADRLNSRVLLMDPDLEFKKEIICKRKPELFLPWRIFLNESSDRLFVAENGSDGRILVFDFK